MKKLFAVILVVVMALSMVACGTKKEDNSSAKGSGTEKKSESFTVGYINYTDANETPQQFHQGVADWCSANGVKLLYAEAKGDAEAMMKACDNFILQGADIIIDSNWNYAGGSALVKKCNDANIPLISIDTYYEGKDSYFVGIDNEAVGKLAGEAAVKYIKKKFNGSVDYVVVSYSASLESINARTTKSVDGIRDAGINVPDDHYFELECGSGDATQLAKQQMTDWLTAHPDGTVAIVAGNAEMALGFQSAIESQNRSNDCIIVSQGMDSSSKAAISSGSDLWVAATDFMCYHYADTLCPLMVKLVNGERPEEVYNYVNMQFVDGDNYSQVVK